MIKFPTTVMDKIVDTTFVHRVCLNLEQTNGVKINPSFGMVQVKGNDTEMNLFPRENDVWRCHVVKLKEAA